MLSHGYDVARNSGNYSGEGLTFGLHCFEYDFKGNPFVHDMPMYQLYLIVC